MRFDAYSDFALRVDPLGHAVHCILQELVRHADDAVDRAVGSVHGPGARRRRLRRPAVRPDDAHGRRRYRLVAAGDLEQVQLVDFFHGTPFAGDQRVEVAVVDLALLIRQLLEGDEHAIELGCRDLVAEVIQARLQAETAGIFFGYERQPGRIPGGPRNNYFLLLAHLRDA